MAEGWTVWLMAPAFLLLIALCVAKKKSKKRDSDVVADLEAVAERSTADTSFASLQNMGGVAGNDAPGAHRFSDIPEGGLMIAENTAFLAFDGGLSFGGQFGESSMDFAAFDGTPKDFDYISSLTKRTEDVNPRAKMLEDMSAVDLNLGYDYVSAPTMDFGPLGEQSTDSIYAEAVDSAARTFQAGALGNGAPRSGSGSGSDSVAPVRPERPASTLSSSGTPAAAAATVPDEDLYVDLNKDAQAKQTARMSMSFAPSTQAKSAAVVSPLKEAAKNALAKKKEPTPAPPQPAFSEMYEDMKAPPQSNRSPSRPGVSAPVQDTMYTAMAAQPAAENFYTAMGAAPGDDTMYTAMSAPPSQEVYTSMAPLAASMAALPLAPGRAAVPAAQQSYVNMSDANIPRPSYEDVDLNTGGPRRPTFGRTFSNSAAAPSAKSAAMPARPASSYVNLSVSGEQPKQQPQQQQHVPGFIPPSSSAAKRGAGHSYVNTADGRTPVAAAVTAASPAAADTAANYVNLSRSGSSGSAVAEPNYGNLGPNGSPLAAPASAASPVVVVAAMINAYNTLPPARPAPAQEENVYQNNAESRQAAMAAVAPVSMSMSAGTSRQQSTSSFAPTSPTPVASASASTRVTAPVPRPAAMGATIPEWLVAPKNTERYKALPQNRQSSSAVPAFARNKMFNRHMDVLPNPATRVPLSSYPGDETSTYINANFIHNCLGDAQAYICTQAPLDRTITHFWRMIWEHNVHHIAMATALVEKGEDKCIQYWPDEPGMNLPLQDFQISLTNVIPNKGYVCNVLDVEYGDETRRVYHWWFKAWPDHGVPRSDGRPDPTDCINMLMSIRARRERDGSGPIAMHCSAGVGRSGAMIAMDICLGLLDTYGRVDPAHVVQEMREDRVALVQHPQQYELVHAACHYYATNIAHHAVRDDPSAVVL